MDFGVHLSLGRKPEASLELASRERANGVQIFASSPGQWRPPIMADEDVVQILDARLKHGIDYLFIHAIYLINLASADRVLASRSRGSLRSTLKAASRLESSGVVTHIGSHAGQGFESVAEQIGALLVEILEESPEDMDLILENSAGAGGIVGSHLEEIGRLIEIAGSNPRLKVAVDTAHLCAAGWDLKDHASVQSLVKEIDSAIGIERLAVIHANDSRVECGRRVDRHAIVGEGHIGTEGFVNLLARPELRAVPWILETPDLGSQDEAKRFVSLRRLRELSNECGVVERSPEAACFS